MPVRNSQHWKSNISMANKGFKGGTVKGHTSTSLRRTMSFAKKAPFDANLRSGGLSGIFKIIGYSTIRDKLLLFVGCISALVSGVCWPIMNYLLANFADKLSVILVAADKIAKGNLTLCNSTLFENSTESSLSEPVDKVFCELGQTERGPYRFPTENEWESTMWTFTLPALGTTLLIILSGYLSNLLLNSTAERIVLRARKLFLQSVLRQDVTWFDSRGQGELTTYIMRSMSLIEIALGEKLGMLLFCFSEVTSSLIICFYSGWQLTLVLCCLYPVLIVIANISNQIQHRMSKLIRTINGEVAGILQEVISSIKTVMAFGGEEKELKRFLLRLRVSRETNIKQTIISGMNYSFIFLITQCFTALGFWYGMKLMMEATNYSTKDVLVINTCVLLSGVFINISVPLAELIGNGFSAANDIVAVIERKPSIDSHSGEGITMQHSDDLQGDIEFQNVHFWYPTNLGEKRILKGLNLRVTAGDTVALVGPSGGGKSTILQLVQRFYDPQKGKVKIDGKNLHEFNLGWLRKRIGVVSQEPSLFNTTVRENICYGNEDATYEDVVRAAKEADAHGFIMGLPQQYDTIVGEQGGQMSGGQRQKIAIARALVRNPCILLLDEATSALDNESEVMVQASLDKAKVGRTSIVIAHRLSTIRNADRIISVKGGKVVEQGTHDELIEKRGVYYQLQLSQKGEPMDEEELDDENDPTDEEEDEQELDGETEEDDSDMDDYFHFNLQPTAIDEEEKREMKKVKQAFWKILLFSKDDWIYIISGILFAIICGCYHSARCYIFARITNMVVLKQFNDQNQIILFPCLYVVVGFMAFIAFSLKAWSISRAEENLLFRVREKLFESITHQEIGWFDDEKNVTSNLVSLVAVEAENVKFIPGTILCTWTYTAIGSSLLVILSLYFNWKLALATGSIAVLVFVSQYYHTRTVRGAMFNLQTTEDKANNLALEAVRNIRTVITFHIEGIMMRLYENALGQPRSITDFRAQFRAIISALSEGFMLLGFTVASSYGGILMYQREISYFEYNVIFAMLIINMMEIAKVLAACPVKSKASMAAYRVKKVTNRRPIIDSNPSAGLQLPANIETKIVFRDCRFSYPSRPSDEILQGLNLTIEEGQTVAFVGKSGCGKSTTMQLLLRFYDPTKEGSVSISGYDLRCVNIPSLRSLISIVSQEPILFNRTIAENIAYGDNTRQVCMHEIIDAAKQANIHETILALRQGYETRLGQRGVQLSGGQKQRVAIARALIRNPRILLLDEATSALDNESEKIVQDALEKAREGRTCLIIAHRLSTVQNVDQIAVFDGGQVVEKGTPQELCEQRGHYYGLLQINQGRRRFSRPLL